jgi:omega-6 fatty acid desaturase (delta-12 desaturase)
MRKREAKAKARGMRDQPILESNLTSYSAIDTKTPNLDDIPDPRALVSVLGRYREPNNARSVFELGITAAAFVLIWVLMWAAIHYDYWIGLLLFVPCAGFLVRLFMIQHDCGHGSFFRHRLANDWVGRIIGVFTLTPYDFWRRAHAEHHAGSGNLDRRGIGDIDTLTVREYLALSRRGKLLYRLYRHPFVMFGIGPAYLFLFRHRVPAGMMRDGWRPWFSTMATNLAIATLAAAMIWLIGIGAFLLVHLPIIVLAASIGVWLFYVQHQFEETYWATNEGWNFHAAALHGSSHYALPHVLRWFSANIGVHHIHHLCSRIPYYRLPEVLRDHPPLAAVGRLTLWQSFQCVRRNLWDERARRLVSFGELASVMADEQRRQADRA